MTDDKEKKMVARVITPERVDDVEVHALRSGDRLAVVHLPEKVPTASAAAEDFFDALRETFSDGTAFLMLPHGATFEIVEVSDP